MMKHEYEAPLIEVMTVVVEQGFAGTGGGYTPPSINTDDITGGSSADDMDGGGSLNPFG